MKKRLFGGLIASFFIFSLLSIPATVFAQTDTPTPTPTPTPSPTPSSGCTDPAPGSTPSLASAVSSGAHSITLTWATATNPVTSYELSYGLSAGNYIYGAPNIGGQGTTTFTVGGLTTGKTYYFIVRAINGCMPGSASNELSGVAGDAPTPTPLPTDTPTPTPEPVIDTPITTPSPTPIPEVLSAENSSTGGSPLVRNLMIGATALGVICAIVGGVYYLKMKKRKYL